MRTYRLTHLADGTLLGALTAVVAHDRATTASLLAHLAEFDARKLYLPAGHPSMFAYCVEALHFAEGSAYKRIRAARAARQFPALFAAVEEGRLHLSAVSLLAAHLTEENVNELIAAATHRGKAELERWLGETFAPPLLVAAGLPEGSGSADAPASRLSPGTVGRVEVADFTGPASDDTPGTCVELSPGTVALSSAMATHVVVRLALSPATHAKLRHAQALLSHAEPSGELAQVVDRALDVLIAQLERRKAALTDRPRKTPGQRPAAKRTIPAHVRRAVWRRDEGRCAFVSSTGRRCSARAWLEFDHRDPVARGGKASPDRVRLLCRAHNQFEAERAFGTGFMRVKREQGRAKRVGSAGDPGAPGERPSVEPATQAPT